MKRINNDYDIDCKNKEVVFYDTAGNEDKRVKITHLIRLYVEFMNDEKEGGSYE